METVTGAHLWADRFDGPPDDVFDLQDRITETVAGIVEPRLQQAEIKRAQLKSTQDLTAYDFYLRGMASYYQMTRTSLDAAIKLFRHAIASDPNYPAALAMLADSITELKSRGWISDYNLEMAECTRLARRAIEIGKDDPIALCYAGFALDYAAGETALGLAMVKRACVLNPNMAQAWCHVGYILTHMGGSDEGIASIERAIRLSPLDPNLHYFWRGIARAHLLAGRYDQAIDWGERALDELPKSAHALRTLTAAYALAGNLREAHRILAMLREAQPSFRLSTANETIAAYHRPDDKRRFLDGLRLAGLPE